MSDRGELPPPPSSFAPQRPLEHLLSWIVTSCVLRTTYCVRDVGGSKRLRKLTAQLRPYAVRSTQYDLYSYVCAYSLAHGYSQDVAALLEVEHHDGQVVLHTEGHCGGVHHA